jgi:hypothetical protein
MPRLRGYNFNDDVTSKNVQANFTDVNVPTSRGSTSEALDGTWMSQYAGPTWNFAWVRKSNILIDRLDNVVKPKISEAAYKHWMACCKIFQGI